jgi:hypothetical protein
LDAVLIGEGVAAAGDAARSVSVAATVATGFAAGCDAALEGSCEPPQPTAVIPAAKEINIRFTFHASRANLSRPTYGRTGVFCQTPDSSP